MPSCGYCKDCKWWSGACELIWEKTTKFRPDPRTSGYVPVQIDTDADFGCVQFEAVSEEDA